MARVASAAAWYYTLKVAVCLARDDVTECVKRTTRKSLAEDESWAELVARPAIRLGTETMKHLSEGWGRGTGFTCLLCWIVSFTNFVALIHNLWQSTSPVCQATPGICKFAREDYNPLRHAAPSLGMAIAPLLICADVADVSSMCDSLMNAINDLRLEWTSTEDHAC